MRWAAWVIPTVAIGHAWASCAAKKPVKALSDADLERLEQSWQAGDEDQELETEDQALAREIRTRENNGELGATMMFVELKGSPDQAETDLFGERMLNLAITGGVQPRVFKLKPGQLVFALNKGWLANSLFDLLKAQEMVKNVEWKDGAHQNTKSKHDEL